SLFLLKPNIPDFTLDSICSRSLQVIQPAQGYRFGIDSVILAHLIKPKPVDTLLDLGTGCGIIPLIIAYKHTTSQLIGVEIQEEQVVFALENLKLNGMQDRIQIIHGDIKKLKEYIPSGTIDIVCSNPPYRKLGSGRVNPHSNRAIARHEIAVNLIELLRVSADTLKRAGRFLVIYPAERMADLFFAMKKNGLEPKFVRMIYSTVFSEAKLVVVEARKMTRPGVKAGTPLIIYNADGSYTDEIQGMLLSV
ncbi:MAG: tRNA1(Val) (adenine(37)-N6)-methyltransferase, partial [Pseudomonadota bacterium]